MQWTLLETGYSVFTLLRVEHVDSPQSRVIVMTNSVMTVLIMVGGVTGIARAIVSKDAPVQKPTSAMMTANVVSSVTIANHARSRAFMYDRRASYGPELLPSRWDLRRRHERLRDRMREKGVGPLDVWFEGTPNFLAMHLSLE